MDMTKMFTQEEVDKIVNEAVNREKSKYCSEIEQLTWAKEKELNDLRIFYDSQIRDLNKEIQRMQKFQSDATQSILGLSNCIQLLLKDGR
jgi:primase-polymerase (primpol)-like protein